MKIISVDILVDNSEQRTELTQQLEQQCIQTVEYTFPAPLVVRVTAHFADNPLHPDLLELLVD